MNFCFDLATPADDPSIRRLFAENPMPGQITLSYEREPDYFLGCATTGPFWQVIVGRHRPSGDVAAVACRAIRRLWINGREQEVGYLSQLRVDHRYRGRWLVAGGFQLLKRLHEDGRAPAYLATIVEDNRQARGVLVERPRRRFPTFRERERLVTVALLLHRRRRPTQATACEITRGSIADLPEFVDFLRCEGAKRQFFPAYTEQDFNGPTTRGFGVEDFFVARRAGNIVGLLGLWDQAAYKQVVVQGYGGALRWTRRLLSLLARVGGVEPLPPQGGRLRFAYASFMCIANDEPAIFKALLQHLLHAAAARGSTFLMLGLAARDPLLAVARRYLHVPYYSRLYTVSWPDGDFFDEQLDERIPYIEIATL